MEIQKLKYKRLRSSWSLLAICNMFILIQKIAEIPKINEYVMNNSKRKKTISIHPDHQSIDKSSKYLGALNTNSSKYIFAH